MRHEMLTQRALFCHRTNTKRGTLSQHFVTHVVPPLVAMTGPEVATEGEAVAVASGSPLSVKDIDHSCCGHQC